MLLIYSNVMDAVHCDRLITEHDSNPAKRITADADASFDGRVVFLHHMTDEVRYLASCITLEAGRVLGRHFQTELYPETVSTVRWDPGQIMLPHRDGQRPETSERSHA